MKNSGPDNIKVFGELEPGALRQIKNCVGPNDIGVLCADHHVGYSQPIGGVVAYKNHISPSGVGYDIACGNKAVKTDLKAHKVKIAKVMDQIMQRISFGVGGKYQQHYDHPVIDQISNAEFKPQQKLLNLARQQLGTVGSGNHYVDLFKDEDGWLWIGVHFGSRGFGHKTASGFLALAVDKDFHDTHNEGEMFSPPILFEVGSDLGQSYITAMKLAGEYAYAGRDIVVEEVLQILKAKAVLEVHNHHNFAWEEEHFGDRYWVVRKGATPSQPGQQSFVGSTMFDKSYIIEGLDTDENREALYSTVHGAGRKMSRRQAKKSINYENTRCLAKKQGIELRGGGADEAPEAYKKLAEVLKYHKKTVKVVTELTPIGVAMAGSKDYDPYKD